MAPAETKNPDSSLRMGKVEKWLQDQLPKNSYKTAQLAFSLGYLGKMASALGVKCGLRSRNLVVRNASSGARNSLGHDSLLPPFARLCNLGYDLSS